MEILTGKPEVVPTHSSWKLELKNAFRDLESLLDFVKVAPQEIPGLNEPGSRFGVFATRSYARRIKKADPRDPLLLQIVPRVQEPSPRSANKLGTTVTDEESSVLTPSLNSGSGDPAADHFQAHSFEGIQPVQPDWSLDPVGDAKASRTPGLIHKYAGRVLLIMTGACAIHCRYCFRQHFDYSSATRPVSTRRETMRRDADHPGPDVEPARWGKALDYIRADSSIIEVILSGGDPLMVADDELASLVKRIESIPHVRHLRIHTRMPVVLPSRMTARFLQILAETHLATRIVLHVNHANELDEHVADSIGQIQSTGALVMNQAVLLKDINDSFLVQKNLSLRLILENVLPYYLHLLDQVRGAEPFDVPVDLATAIHRQLLTSLPGYAVPRLVQEVAGELSKRPIA